MTDPTAQARELAEQLHKYIDHYGLYGTSPEPEKYPDQLYPTKELDARNIVVKILTAALLAAEQRTLESAAEYLHQSAASFRESKVNLVHPDQLCERLAKELLFGRLLKREVAQGMAKDE